MLTKKKKYLDSLTMKFKREYLTENQLDEKMYDKDDIGQAMNYALEELESVLKKVRNPEDWAEKYHRSASQVIENIEKLIITLEKMK